MRSTLRKQGLLLEKPGPIFDKRKNVFKNHELTIITNMRLLHCSVFFLYYGVKVCALTGSLNERLKRFRRGCIEKCWVRLAHTGLQMTRFSDEWRNIKNLTTVKSRTLQYLGQIIFESLIIKTFRLGQNNKEVLYTIVIGSYRVVLVRHGYLQFSFFQLFYFYRKYDVPRSLQ